MHIRARNLELKLNSQREGEREREPGERGVSSEESWTRRAARANRLGSSQPLLQSVCLWHSTLQSLSHGCYANRSEAQSQNQMSKSYASPKPLSQTSAYLYARERVIKFKLNQ